MTSPTSRQAHAVLDLPSRQLKAIKIERLLNLKPRGESIRILEIGCGSGGISHYFATHPELDCTVDAIDVVDNRLVSEGYEFRIVDDVLLPFADQAFDVVITNHVIEHVGDGAAQAAHLREIRRVIKPNGTGYLAVPNRWQLIEPHYRLMFLSWLPRSLRSPYLKLSGKGTFYDCEPLTVAQLESMLADAGFTFRNSCVHAARLMFELERPESVITALLRHVPDPGPRPLQHIIPTLIYLFHPVVEH